MFDIFLRPVYAYNKHNLHLECVAQEFMVQFEQPNVGQIHAVINAMNRLREHEGNIY